MAERRVAIVGALVLAGLAVVPAQTGGDSVRDTSGADLTMVGTGSSATMLQPMPVPSRILASFA